MPTRRPCSSSRCIPTRKPCSRRCRRRARCARATGCPAICADGIGHPQLPCHYLPTSRPSKCPNPLISLGFGAGEGEEGRAGRAAMYRVPAVLIVFLLLAVPARAAPSHLGELSTLDAVQKWMYGYRAKPEPGRVPEALRTLNRLGALKDPETSGIYVGFLAGVIGADPAKADELLAKLFPVPPADQWVIVRAIAYSGHPQWKHLMLKYAARMPARKVMIEKYLARELATLNEVPLEHPDPGLIEMLKSELGHQPKEVVAVLKEVIEAADTADVGRIRKEALAAVEELKRKGPGYKRDISFWGQVGEGAVSLGCVAAAALGQIEFGIPCVVGGAATSAAVRYWSSPQ